MLDANSELAQGYLIDTLLKYLKKSKSISLLMKMRGRSTATSLQLLDVARNATLRLAELSAV